MTGNNGKMEIKNLQQVEVSMTCRDVDQVFEDIQKDLDYVKEVVNGWFSVAVKGWLSI